VKGSFLHTLLYAAVLGGVCATLLAVCNELTRARIEENRQAEKMRNVMEVLGIEFDRSASAKDLLKLSGNCGIEKVRTPGGLDLYKYARQGRQLLAVEFSGPGLWGPIRGVVAFDRETKVICGISFYEQEETPGLGGEIGADSFRRRFEGKRIRSGGLRIVPPGAASTDSEVDGISGATITCRKVEDMLNRTIEKVIREVADE